MCFSAALFYFGVNKIMPIGFEAFDLSGRVSIELGDSDKVLVRIRRDAQSADNQLVKLEKQAIATANAFRQLNQLQGQKLNAGVPRPPAARPATGEDTAMRRAQADIARAQAQRLKWESDYTSHVARQSEQQYRARVTSYQKGLQDFQGTLDRQKKTESAHFSKSLRDIDANVSAAAGNIRNSFSSAFSGGFFGGIAGNITTSFLSVLSQLPGKAKAVFDEMTDLAAEQQNAFKGLESIAVFKGIDGEEAKSAVQNLRLVKAGVIDVASSSNALKSLLSTGFGLDQANTLLERFSDSAAFGKQSALTFSQAIERTAEGLKQGNSNLFDAAGITKNLSVILKEQGFELEDLSDKNKKAAALQALYNGIVSETQAQVGDADKLTQGWTGSVAALDTAQNNLYKTIGDIIIQNSEFTALIRVMTGEINNSARAFEYSRTTNADFAAGLEGSNVTIGNTGKKFNSTVSELSRFIVELEVFGTKFDAAMRIAQLNAGQIGTSMRNIGRLIIGGLYEFINFAIVDPVNDVIDKINYLKQAARDYLPSSMTPTGGDIPKLRRDQSPFGSIDQVFRDDRSSVIKTRLDSGDISRNRDEHIKGILDNFNKFRSEYKDENKKTRDASSKDGRNTGAATAGAGSAKETSKANAAAAKELKAASQTFNAASIAAFVRNQGFIPGSGFTKKGHNTDSAHGDNRALDVGLNATNSKKTVQEIVTLMANGIKAGLRARDERVRPPGQKVWSAAHIHFEENDKMPSFFNSALDYGGQLEYLKSLDKERLAGKGTKSISAALDPENAKRRQEEAEREAKQLKDRLERERELKIRDREQTDDRFIESARSRASKEEAIYENMFAHRRITESEYADYSAKAQLGLLEKERKTLQERLTMAELSAKDRLDIEHKISLLTDKIEQTSIERNTKAVRAFEEAAETFRQEVEDFENANYEKNLESFESLNGIVTGLGGTFTSLDGKIFGAKTELQGLNEYFANPANRASIEEYAKALGYTGAQLENIIRQLQEGKAQIGNTRPRVVGVQPQKGFGETVGAGLSAEFGLGNIGTATAGAMDETTARAAAMKAVYQDLGNTVVDVFGSMAGAATGALENFILTGEGGAAAFASLAASAIANLAIQSGVKSLFEFAEASKESALAVASAAIGDVRGAALHGAAAAAHVKAGTMYALIGGGAAAGGIAIGLAGGLGGGRGGSASSGSGNNNNNQNQPDYYTVQSPPPQTAPKYSADPVTLKLLETVAVQNSNLAAQNSHLAALGEEVSGLRSIIQMGKPGDVLERGIAQKRGLITDTLDRELGTDATKVKKISGKLNLG